MYILILVKKSPDHRNLLSSLYLFVCAAISSFITETGSHSTPHPFPLKINAILFLKDFQREWIRGGGEVVATQIEKKC